MGLLHPQLAALSAILEEGSFDAAARRLSVTPSAVSQRIKALEDRLGHVLVVRTHPCRPTPAGERLLRHVAPMRLLEHDAMATFEPAKAAAATTLAIAVNEDSLSTWFLSALARLHAEHGHVFDIRVDDQAHTLDLLRSGQVIGAVTSEASPLQGCNVQVLGTMRFVAIASPSFAAQHFPDGLTAESLARAPLIVFNRKDALQWRFIRRITRAKLAPPVHYLPTSTGFVDAAALGLGWCLAPESLAAPALKARRIVGLDASRWLDVPLYWQHAAVTSDTLRRLGTALRDAAAEVLRT